MSDNPRPWWAPDAQGFLACAIVLICAVSLFMRMRAPSVVDDKMLETMLTILFSTCLVTVYNFSFGSSRGSAAKDDTQNKIVEKLTSPSGPVMPAEVRAAAEVAAAAAAPPAAIIAAPPAAEAAAEAAAPAAAKEAVAEALTETPNKERDR